MENLDVMVLRALREGLAAEPARSGEAAALHGLIAGWQSAHPA